MTTKEQAIEKLNAVLANYRCAVCGVQLTYQTGNYINHASVRCWQHRPEAMCRLQKDTA